MNIKKKRTSLKDELIELRRDFHKYSEPEFKEHRTSEIIADYLKK